jgi:hypothetical protein
MPQQSHWATIASSVSFGSVSPPQPPPSLAQPNDFTIFGFWYWGSGAAGFVQQGHGSGVWQQLHLSLPAGTTVSTTGWVTVSATGWAPSRTGIVSSGSKPRSPVADVCTVATATTNAATRKIRFNGMTQQANTPV